MYHCYNKASERLANIGGKTMPILDAYPDERCHQDPVGSSVSSAIG